MYAYHASPPYQMAVVLKKKYTRKTPVQYLTFLRMTNAQVLLETTTYSVNEIGRIVGYNNALYFSRIFHKQKGCSPSTYRSRVNGKA